jgi:transposase
MTNLHQAFKSLKDPRIKRNRKHSLLALVKFWWITTIFASFNILFAMEFSAFVKELLHIDDSFQITLITRALGDEQTPPHIYIYLEYQLPCCEKEGVRYRLYDHAPERTRQHLCWVEYPCFITCRLPRYIDSQGKVRLLDVSFAEKGKSYTRLFSAHVIEALKQIKVQTAVARLFHTPPCTVRNIMENAVSRRMMHVTLLPV